MNILDLVVHFTNALCVRLNSVIGVREIDGPHMSDSLATLVMDTVEQ